MNVIFGIPVPLITSYHSQFVFITYYLLVLLILTNSIKEYNKVKQNVKKISVIVTSANKIKSQFLCFCQIK